MKIRHKIPAVFSIYMVDVLCCALGCVILLWQLYHHESEEQTAKNDVITKKNDEFSKKNDEIRSKLDDANLIIASLTRKNQQSASELNTTRQDRDQAQKLALIRKQDYDKLKKVYDDAEKLVALLRVD